jgi:Lipid A 3-O-deacylase (PagL)
MRAVAALLLGGLIHCCVLPGVARAADATATTAGVDVPAAAESATGPAVLFAAGVFALVEAYDYPYSVGATYIARTRTAWKLAPGAGFAVGADGIAFLYLDVRRDFRLGESHWFFTPSLAAGWFINGDEIGPRDHLEFQSGIMFAREFANGLRAGIAGLHISNGGLEQPNNGTESVVFTLQVPLGSPRP